MPKRKERRILWSILYSCTDKNLQINNEIYGIRAKSPSHLRKVELLFRHLIFPTKLRASRRLLQEKSQFNSNILTVSAYLVNRFIPHNYHDAL